jgi:hypothetical protein
MDVEARSHIRSTATDADKQKHPPPKMPAPFKVKVWPLINELLLVPENKQSPPSNLKCSVVSQTIKSAKGYLCLNFDYLQGKLILATAVQLCEIKSLDLRSEGGS